MNADDLTQEACERWLDGPGRRLLRLGDADYPPLLAGIASPPRELWVEGRIELLQGPALAVVGSRNPTPAGDENARAFARALSAAGITVVSGLARGIDGAAHAAALDGPGSTVAVLGVGPDIAYPRGNAALQRRIAEEGCVVSEFAPGTPARKGQFPRRNRIIAGLSLGCLVVEAALESGSLKTARDALDEGREVFAIPGSIHSPQSRGCHRLIRQGAMLTETLADILGALRLPLEGLAPTLPSEAAPAPEHPLLPLLGDSPCTLDTLIERSGWDAASALAELTELELEGRVARTADGRFQRLWLG